MKKVNIFYFLLFLFFSTDCNKSLNVRVLLEELDEQNVNLKIGQFDPKLAKDFSNKFIVSAPANANLILNTDDLHIQYGNESFIVNDESINSDRIVISSENGLLTLNNTPYEGSLVLIKQPKSIYLINVVDIESYVASVLYGESWPGWSLRVNEIFSIMCRTYVSSKIFDTRKRKNKFYDIKNSNHHQTYKGYHEFDNLKLATLNTAGLILTHEKKPILAMYDCCCGGIVPSHVQGVIDFEKAPYLARRYACNFCKGCKIYNWDIQYNFNDLEQLLKTEFKSLKKVKEIRVVSKDSAGMVKLVKISDSAGKAITVTGKKIYTLLKKVKSLNFTVHKRGNNFVFKGKGYGHQIGLCQWGVHQLLKDTKNLQKWTVEKVLSFYYPKTKLMKIKA